MFLLLLSLGFLFKKDFFKVCGRSVIPRCKGYWTRGLTRMRLSNYCWIRLEIFLIAFISIVGIDKLRFPGSLEFEIFEVPFKTIVHGYCQDHTHRSIYLVAAYEPLILSVIVAERKSQSCRRIKDHQLVVFFRDFLKVIVGIIGMLMVLGMAFGFEVSKLWTGLGIAGAALALSTKGKY